MFAFLMLTVGAMILCRTKPSQDHPFRCFAGWVARPLAIASIAFLMFSLPLATWIRFVVCAAICVVVYFCYRCPRSPLRN
jgi:basic amino acid/polyamine antiporter, APA family